MFKLSTAFEPRGDQPQAIAQLVAGLQRGYEFQTLLGATGTGKTFTMASVIAAVQRPALVIAHNKTLAAQLCQEFRAFFPENAVHFFISYYDYYQPEAYVPQTDTYIEKTASINDEIDRLRHAATQAVLERRDVIVVASVSSIYGLGSPQEYLRSIVTVRRGDRLDPRELAMRLVELQYVRSDMVLGRGTFRIRGDVIDVQPADEEYITRIELFGDEVERITEYDPLKGETIAELERANFFPATHYVTPWDRMDAITAQIREELEAQVAYFESQGRLIEAQRIRQRVEMDLEMMRELGYCNGIENYSRYFDGRKPGEPPYTLLDYFPDDYLLFVDESHQTIPQIRAMYNGDLQRKRTLVEYGFRLPSALDNRPLRFEEFLQRVGQVIFVSATPGPFERQVSQQIVEQIIRPTGLLDPEVVVRPTQGQIDDLIAEIRQRIERNERTLVTTLTKKMAEDLTNYLQELGIRVQYLHSDVQSLERAEILRDLRLGTYDVVVGVNLLREGLDLPEVSLVAILDADKEGFLRSETSLIQTIGRAARNKFGTVILYADRITGSMQRAIDETNRRRQVQMEYNQRHGITPETVRKEVRETVRAYKVAEERASYQIVDTDRVAFEDLPLVIDRLEQEMRQAAKALEFERAAILRDEIQRLRRILETSGV
ncbi:excinuclease ABC subunit UvrB [Synechococcus sp. RC10A2]|uniref:excinuclease ABC subunit UvrB n=1 Tax=Synechococcus sp. RC10A2 TaxID=2964529 RepID=UPI0039C6CD4C